MFHKHPAITPMFSITDSLMSHRTGYLYKHQASPNLTISNHRGGQFSDQSKGKCPTSPNVQSASAWVFLSWVLMLWNLKPWLFMSTSKHLKWKICKSSLWSEFLNTIIVDATNLSCCVDDRPNHREISSFCKISSYVRTRP